MKLQPITLSAGTLNGTTVRNTQGEELGHIEDLMIDLDSGHIAYTVLSFGGFMGLGDKYFAIPWQALSVDAENRNLILNVEKERLENAPGFDKDKWPSSANREYMTRVYNHYGYEPYWP